MFPITNRARDNEEIRWICSCGTIWIYFRERTGPLTSKSTCPSHVETVCCLYHQKKDFISVPYEPNDTEYLKNIDDRHHKNTGMICTKRTGGTQ